MIRRLLIYAIAYAIAAVVGFWNGVGVGLLIQYAWNPNLTRADVIDWGVLGALAAMFALSIYGHRR